MPKSVVLFISSGQTDLQVLVEDSEKQYFAKVAKKSIRNFHEALLEGKQPYKIKDNIKKIEEAKKIELVYISQKLISQHSKEQSESEPLSVVYDEDSIYLVPVKLLTIVENLLNEDLYKVNAVVVFNTHRKDSKKFFHEPIACGNILVKWIADVFELEVSPEPAEGKACFVNILDKEMEMSGEFRNYPVNRKAVARIEKAMEAFHGKELFACLSLGGGMPKFKDCIKACADFKYGQEKVFYWDEPQFSKELKLYSPDEIYPSPVESFQTRSHVVHLIEKGNFIAAYLAAQCLEKDSEEKKWICYVKEIHDYFLGKEIDTPQLETVKEILKYKKRCLMAAMRTESSLRAKRIPDAINWTCTFFDAALLDFIEQTQGNINFMRRVVTYPHGKTPDPKLFSSNSAILGCLEPISKSKQTYKYSTSAKHIETWCEVIGSQKMKQYFKALRTPQSTSFNSISPYEYRNFNIHAQIFQKSMETEVQEIFEKAKLWTSKNKNYMFIGTEEVKHILEELGIQNPDMLYNKLVKELKDKLHDYEIK